MTALCAPTVNAYRRLRPGALNGYWGNWGYAHRCAGNRVPEARGSGTRIESRLSDGAANIHLAVATVLQAARLGVVNGYDCPPPLTGDGFEDSGTDVHCAASLGAALDDLRADTALTDAVGADCVANFIDNKQSEWDQYLAAVGTDLPGPVVTQWELDTYRNFH
jgi:glutamine synthetase